MPKNRLRVAISGFGGLDNPEPGVAVARALRDGWPEPLAIEALGYDVDMTGAWSPGLVDNAWLLPSLADGDDALYERIMEIHSYKPLDAIIPCLDLEIPYFARIARQLDREGIRVMVPSADRVNAVSKIHLPDFCHRNDILAPKTIHLFDVKQVKLYGDQMGYPLMVKGTVANAKRVENAEEAVVEAEKYHAKWGGGVLLQEPIAGEEYVVSMVIGRDGQPKAEAAVRKLVTSRKGKAIVGVVVDDPAIYKVATAIREKLNWTGPLELEFIRQPDTGNLYLIEVNPRFPSWIQLSGWAGVNAPVIYLNELMGREQPRRRKAKAGIGFVRDVEETSISWQTLQDLERHGSAVATPALGNGRRLRNGGARVGVSGVSALDVVMPGLGVAQSLRHEREVAHLVGFAYGNYDTGVYRPDLFDEIFRLPDTTDPDELLDAIGMIQQEAGLDVIVPSLDVEMTNYDKMSKDLKKIGIRTLAPDKRALDSTGKLSLFTASNRIDWGAFELLESMKIWTLKGVDTAIERFGLPLVIKGPVSGAESVDAADDARTEWMRLREKGHKHAIAQPFIAGDEYAVTGVCGRDHELIDVLPVKKLIQCEDGKTWGAIPIQADELVASVAEFLREHAWCGPFELEFIRDARRDHFHLLEVNPRFPAWISMAAECGVNLPLQTVRAALDLPTPDMELNEETVFVRTARDYPLEPGRLASFAMTGSMRHG